MFKVLALDPGDSTGIVLRTGIGELLGDTVVKCLREIHEIITDTQPDVIVFETFRLYASSAVHLVHNEMYPSQVIGAIKLSAAINQTSYVVPLSPSDKKFAGALKADPRYASMYVEAARTGREITEHTRDAMQLLKYFERVIETDLKRLSKYFNMSF